MKRIAAFVPYVTGKAPGQRMRIELWAHYLRQAGWVVDFYSFEDSRLHEVLYQPGHFFAKVGGMASCYIKQLRAVLAKPRCDLLFIYREVALIGPALLERIAMQQGVPVVYDLDDPVFLSYHSEANPLFGLLKCHQKTRTLLRLSRHVICINQLIGDYAVQFNSNVSIIPNCVDINDYQLNRERSDVVVRLVWIGSHSTLQNLASIASPLRRLQADSKVAIRIIGFRHASLAGVQIEALDWSAESEIANLRECDIGLVPLNHHPWNPWKFFFKTIQYMAMGIPVVARRMGSNIDVIQDGINGFLVETEEEWHDRLRLLINNPILRRHMGEAARQTVVHQYSTQVHMPNMVALFERLRDRLKENTSNSSV